MPSRVGLNDDTRGRRMTLGNDYVFLSMSPWRVVPRDNATESAPLPRASGRIKRPVDYAHIRGGALAEFERVRPDVRIINLETAVIRAEDARPGKGIHYRMHPANVPCLSAAKIDLNASPTIPSCCAGFSVQP